MVERGVRVSGSKLIEEMTLKSKVFYVIEGTDICITYLLLFIPCIILKTTCLERPHIAVVFNTGVTLYVSYNDGLVQERRKSSALAMQLRHFALTH